MSNQSSEKNAAITVIETINEVEGFNPAPLAVKYVDMNTQEERMRLPVMSQIAWFRLKYPEGKIAKTVKQVNDYFIATARVYKSYQDPPEHFLAEGTASRAYSADKPNVSPREWAQTAATGIALRDAGFGLQFHAAGDSFEEAAVIETDSQPGTKSNTGNSTTSSGKNDFAEQVTLNNTTGDSIDSSESKKTSKKDASPKTPDSEETATEFKPEQTKELTLEDAKKVQCPINKHKDKTLGDLITMEPKALSWLATKFEGDPAVSEAAKLICENALANTA